MKINQSLFIRNRITLNREHMMELESLLKEYCDSVKYSASTKDKSYISYTDLDEMLKQSNYGDKKIRKIDIRSSSKESPDYINLELDGRDGFGKSNIEISYSFSDPSKETLFQSKIKDFFDKRKDGDRAYTIASMMMFPLSLAICFFLLCLCLKYISSDVNAVMPVMTILFLVFLVYLVYGVCGKLFPAISFVWGEEENHYNQIVKRRNNIFWCVLVSIAISIGCTILFK